MRNGVVADAAATAVGLCRTLRAAGVPVTTDRAIHFVEALTALDPRRRGDVYWAGRLTLCGTLEDVARYERAFAAYFGGEAPHQRVRPRLQTRQEPRLAAVDAAADGDSAGDDALRVHASASRAEVLRQRDLASLAPADRDIANRLLAVFALPGEARRTRRWRTAPRGRLDRGRTVREVLGGLGDPARLRYQRHALKPRRVVLLVDVSGSMAPYADALLRFAHTAAHRHAFGPRRPGPRGGLTEVFTIGTRLTRVSRELAQRDPDSAMAAVLGAVPDWSGGTRLGDLLKAFLDGWGQRGMARGAVAVILSDGWERGDVTLLAEQMARLARLAHRVVWANPRKGQSGYAPLAAGMAAALPYVDDFVAGHSVAALERLARVVSGHAARVSPWRAAPTQPEGRLGVGAKQEGAAGGPTDA